MHQNARMMNFQRDGMIQTQVFKGRANYELNSLDIAGEESGPRECPVTGFSSLIGRAEDDEQGNKLRIRPESFADHLQPGKNVF